MRIGIALAAVLAVTGCVSQEKYRVKEQEADKYRTDWQQEVVARQGHRQAVRGDGARPRRDVGRPQGRGDEGQGGRART